MIVTQGQPVSAIVQHMDVLFVHTPIPGAPFSSSIAALSAWLKMHGHHTKLLTLPTQLSPADAGALFAPFSPDVVAWSFMSCRSKDIPALLQAARSALPGVRHIAGGAHPTTYPQETLPLFDALVVGEGEAPLLHWLNHPNEPHPGLLRRDQSDPVTHWWAPDVDALPDWDRSLFGNVRNHGNRYEQAIPVAFSRGFCPFSCTFCGVDAYRRVHKQPQRGASRLRQPARVLQEIQSALKDSFSPVGFAAWDEVLPMKRAWLQEFFTSYKEEVGLPFAVQLRVEQVSKTTVDILAKGGCDYVVVGVETGDEEYRRRFLNKPFSNAQTIEAFQRLHDAGITTFCSFMIGLPFETPKMLAKTVRLAQVLRATELSWKYYTPERGTALFPLLEEHQLLIEKYIDHPFGAHEAMIRMTHCTQTDLDHASAALALLRGDSPRGTFEQVPATDTP